MELESKVEYKTNHIAATVKITPLEIVTIFMIVMPAKQVKKPIRMQGVAMTQLFFEAHVHSGLSWLVRQPLG